jgi:hypothetical protein
VDDGRVAGDLGIERLLAFLALEEKEVVVAI